MRPAAARRHRVLVGLAAGLLAPAVLVPAAPAAGWLPTATPLSAIETSIDMEADAGADGTAVIAWAAGPTMRVAVKPSGSAAFGAPVVLGGGTDADVAVGPDGRVLVAWTAGPAGIQVAELPPGAAAFADRGIIPGSAGTRNPRLDAFPDGRVAMSYELEPKIHFRILPAGAVSFPPGPDPGLNAGGTITGSDIAAGPSGDLLLASTWRLASSTQVIVTRFDGTGSGLAILQAETDFTTGSPPFQSSTTVTHSEPRIIEGAKPVVVFVRSANTTGFPLPSSTTTLRSIADPLGASPTVGTVDAASISIVGSFIRSPVLSRRTNGTVTAAWVTAPSLTGVGEPALRTADLAPAATTFTAGSSITGFGTPANLLGAPRLGVLAGGALAVADADNTAVRGSISPPGQPFPAASDLTAGVTAAAQALLAGDDAGGLVAAWSQNDDAGRRAFVRLYDDGRPTISDVTAPTELRVGQSGAFSATARDPWTGAGVEWDFGDGATATGSSASHAFTAPGTYAVRATARDQAGNVSDAVERVVRVPAPVTPSAGPDTTAPVISGLSLSTRRFAVAAAKRRAVVKRGTTVRFTLSEPARVTMTVTRAVRGYRSGKRCVAARPRGLRTPRRCTLTRTLGTLSVDGRAGANSVPFKGRIGGRGLKPAAYRLTVRARDAAGNRSRTAAAAFTIAR